MKIHHNVSCGYLQMNRSVNSGPEGQQFRNEIRVGFLIEPPLKSSPNEKLLGLVHTGSQVLHLNYDMDAYMATFFGGEAWDLCCELG